MSDTELMSAPDLIDELRALVGESNVLDGEDAVLYSQDVFEKSDFVTTVVQPTKTSEVSAVVGASTAYGAAVIPRGGGMSYTSGYIPVESGSVTIDLSAMNKIVEVNTEDMYVTCEAGVTWKQLYERLSETGLRILGFRALWCRCGFNCRVGGGFSGWNSAENRCGCTDQ